MHIDTKAVTDYLKLLVTIIFLLPSLLHADEYPEYRLSVSFDVAASSITGLSQIDAKAGRELIINRGTLKIDDIRVANKKYDVNREQEIIRITPEHDGVIEIRFRGIFGDGKPSGENYGIAESVIGESGISLTGTWYPAPDGLMHYTLLASLPEDYEAISEAEHVEKTLRQNSVDFLFSFPHPVDGINFVASNSYEMTSDTYNDIDILAYFFRDDQDLARSYIEFTKTYLKMYEGLLGAYPYKRFSIVENFLPTGYSMPTYTLLGRSVVKLPFIVETSLGHEILHQWFGNSVYIDYERGNWAEGLTTYLSDHLYRVQKNEGWEYRKQILIDYRSYVTAENELPIKDFRSRVDYSSRTVGYGKVAMVFHMLKNLVGEDTFFDALKDFIHENRFRKASWDNLEASFVKAFGEDLDWYFAQWVNSAGIPELQLHDFEVSQLGKEFKLHFHTTQNEKIYQFELPAAIYTDTGAIYVTFEIKESRQSFDVMLPERPRRVVFDENYDIARTLQSEELPPVIARLIGDLSPVLILPPDEHDMYQTVIERFQNNGALIKKADEIKFADIEASSVLILDLNNPVIEKLFGKTSSAGAGFYIDVRNNPWNPQRVAGIISGTSRAEVDAAFGKIFHYGKYSTLMFEKGRNIMKEIKPTKRGVLVELSEEAAVVDISEIRTLSDVIESVSDKKIVYVGEVHDVFAHHAVQLDIISGLYKKNNKIAIGMEMFQKPFQNLLDRFVDRKMGEREFLRESEYFNRWGFDYNLYKPILDFAREECIHVIALNTRREIIKSVSHGGIDSLADEEKKEIPAGLDFSDIEYRNRLEKIFNMHEDSDNRNFDNFYQSQILWDETMAESIDNFLNEYPDYQMAVLAGQGHLMYGSGIPRRTHRRNSHDYAIVLIDAEVEKDIADYVVFPKHVKGITSPKLMVFLKKIEEGYEIAGFPEESVSEKAGLKEGDIVLFIDDEKISSIDDIKLHLLYKERGETVTVKILRDEKGKKKKMEFAVEL